MNSRPLTSSAASAGKSENPAAHNQINGEWYFPVRGANPSGSLALTESFVVRLTTLSAWLMGYTAAYLAHWETASSRKSRPKSSASSPESKRET